MLRIRSGILFVCCLGLVFVIVQWPRSRAQDGKKLTSRFQQADKNGDGKVTPAELKWPELFQRLDTNDDQVVTLPEARKAIANGTLKGFDVNQKPTGPQPEPTPTDAPEIREGPVVLKPGDHGVGRFVADVSFKDIRGDEHRLSNFKNKRALVIAMTSTSCPLSKKFLPTLAELSKTYSKQGIQFLIVNPMETDTIEEMQAAQGVANSAVYVADPSQAIVKAVGATTTNDVVVLDPSRTVVYHGAIDDQYGFAYANESPRNRYLVDSLESILAGRPPVIAATTAPGCELELDTSGKETNLTYYRDIARLVQRNCVECHRDGGVAPFSLDTYEDVVDHAPMIKRVVKNGTMPPWFAAQDSDEPNKWSNDRSLSRADKTAFESWVDGGRPAGEKKDAPLPRKYPDGWLIGKPDKEFKFKNPVSVKATGIMPYVNVTVENDLTEDRWIQAIEIKPGDRSVVHHVIVSVRNGRSRSAESFWGIYVPGNSTLVYPDGYAKRLPKGAKLRFQMHYTPNGKATTDLTRMGVIFAKKPPKYEVFVKGLSNRNLSIPARAPNHPVENSLSLPADVQVLAFLPHMHLRGKAAKYEVIRGDGQAETLLDVPRYDFNWQLLYRLAKPKTLRRGERVKFTAWYDNSAGNAANPAPDQVVTWGEQTEDEMHLGYVEYVVPALAQHQ